MSTGDELQQSLDRLVTLGQNPDVNIRPVLLRVLVDLFVRKPYHAPADLAQFEEIAQRLLDEADEETRLIVADKLARHPAMPKALIERFLRERGRLASRILEHAAVEPVSLAAAAAWGTADMAEAVARRSDLDPEVMRTLAERPEPGVVLALLRNHAINLARPTIQYLVRRVRDDETAAAALLARPDARPADAAPLFMSASSEQRAAILLAMRRDDLGPENRRPRLADKEAAALHRVERSLLHPDLDTFDVALASALDLPLDETMRIIDDPRGEPLAVALAAIGASAELAARVFILSGPAIGQSVMAVRTLTATVDNLGMRTAGRLVSLMTDRRPRALRRPWRETETAARSTAAAVHRHQAVVAPADASPQRLQAGRVL